MTRAVSRLERLERRRGPVAAADDLGDMDARTLLHYLAAGAYVANLCHELEVFPYPEFIAYQKRIDAAAPDDYDAMAAELGALVDRSEALRANL